jgi:hypothetical protein
VLDRSEETASLGDRAIRSVLHAALALRHPDAVVVHEMRLRAGRVVLDIAAIDESLHAYEIKSDLDSLARLPRQTGYYDRTCDFVTLVSTNPRHIEAIPTYWGFALAEEVRGHAHITWQRNAGRNPNLQIEELLYVLRSSEIQRLLRANGQRHLEGTTKGQLVAQTLAVLGPRAARQLTIEILHTRKTWSIRQLAVLNEAARLRHAIAQPAPKLSVLMDPMF